MFGLRQTSRISLRLIDGLCLKALSSQQQCHQHVYKFAMHESISRQFSVEANTITKECDLENDKVTKQPLGKIEKKLMVQFTCKKCKTRNTKTMSKLAYDKGVVIIRCDGCKNNHLIADNLGWFGVDSRKRNIETIMKKKGETVKRLSIYDNVMFEFISNDELIDVKNTDKN